MFKKFSNRIPRKVLVGGVAIASVASVALIGAAKPALCQGCGECSIMGEFGPVPGYWFGGYCVSCVGG